MEKEIDDLRDKHENDMRLSDRMTREIGSLRKMSEEAEERAIKAEKKLNFFLKSNEENFKNHIKMNKANDLEVFTYLRHLKDTF